ncbi:MAG: hypothetical protein JWM35_2556, partial [Verrucomicrobia bacterium]|nr:hypothetical protein [Verrucomicrobiota bacterium]
FLPLLVRFSKSSLILSSILFTLKYQHHMIVANQTDPNVKRLISQPTDQKQIGEMTLKTRANIRRIYASNFIAICILSLSSPK